MTLYVAQNLYFLTFTTLFTAGLAGGSNINVAHELLHKENNPVDKFLGCVALGKNIYKEIK